MLWVDLTVFLVAWHTFAPCSQPRNRSLAVAAQPWVFPQDGPGSVLDSAEPCRHFLGTAIGHHAPLGLKTDCLYTSPKPGGPTVAPLPKPPRAECWSPRQGSDAVASPSAVAGSPALRHKLVRPDPASR